MRYTPLLLLDYTGVVTQEQHQHVIQNDTLCATALYNAAAAYCSAAVVLAADLHTVAAAVPSSVVVHRSANCIISKAFFFVCFCVHAVTPNPRIDEHNRLLVTAYINTRLLPALLYEHKLCAR
jgi:hypothetical protein